MGHYQDAYNYDAEQQRKSKSGTRKIADLPKEKQCRDREHNPATMVVREPGVYEHTCPSCGNVQTFTVGHKPTL